MWVAVCTVTPCLVRLLPQGLQVPLATSQEPFASCCKNILQEPFARTFCILFQSPEPKRSPAFFTVSVTKICLLLHHLPSRDTNHSLQIQAVFDAVSISASACQYQLSRNKPVLQVIRRLCDQQQLQPNPTSLEAPSCVLCTSHSPHCTMQWQVSPDLQRSHLGIIRFPSFPFFFWVDVDTGPASQQCNIIPRGQ